MRIIRRASLADVPAIVQRWQELMDAHAGLDPRLYAQATNGSAAFEAFVRRQMEDTDAVVLVSVHRGQGTHNDPSARAEAEEIVGYAVGRIAYRAPFYREREIGLILDVAVRPVHHRMGIGRALVAALEQRFRQVGVEYVQVTYSPANEASSMFWARMGYRHFMVEAYRRL